jgi:hypothetical protein
VKKMSLSLQGLISASWFSVIDVALEMHASDHPKDCGCLIISKDLCTRLLCKNTHSSVYYEVKEFLEQQLRYRPLQYTLLHHGTYDCKLPPLKKEDEEIPNLEEAPGLEKASEPEEETVVNLLFTFVEIFCELTRVEKDLLSIAGFSTRAALFDHIASGGALNHRIKRAAAVAEKFLKERK